MNHFEAYTAQKNEAKFFLGIDGGGTYIRTIVTDNNGHILARTKHQGGAHIEKAPNAVHNMQEALKLTLAKASLIPSQITAIAAGIAGYDSEEDRSWVESLIDPATYPCPILYVNDAVIAHAGAFQGESGIIAICGTGSIVFGKSSDGSFIRNYDLNHYAPAAARHLTRALIKNIAKSNLNHVNPLDADLIQKLLIHFKANDTCQLSPEILDYHLWGDFARNITEAAKNQCPLAQAVCDEASIQVAQSIRLVSSHFAIPIKNVALTGSVATDKYISACIQKELPDFHFKTEFPNPEIGAVILAMQSAGVTVPDSFSQS